MQETYRRSNPLFLHRQKPRHISAPPYTEPLYTLLAYIRQTTCIPQTGLTVGRISEPLNQGWVEVGQGRRADYHHVSGREQPNLPGAHGLLQRLQRGNSWGVLIAAGNVITLQARNGQFSFADAELLCVCREIEQDEVADNCPPYSGCAFNDEELSQRIRTR